MTREDPSDLDGALKAIALAANEGRSDSHFLEGRELLANCSRDGRECLGDCLGRADKDWK